MAQDFTAKFRVDISDLKKNISEANKQIKLANATFKAETAGMENWEKNADGLSSKLKQLREVLEQQKRILSSYEQQLQRQQKSYDDNGNRVEQLKAKLKELADQGIDKASDEYQKYERELRTAIKEQDNSAKSVDDLKIKILNQQAAVGKTEAAINKYSRAEEELGDESKEAAKDVDKLDESLDDVSDSASDAAHGGLNTFGVMLGNLTSRVIEAGIRKLKELATEALNAGMNFESAMSQVEAISGASGSELEALTEKAKEMGAKTKFSASESAEAFNYMAMAGWKTEDMLNGIEGVMALSAASGEDLARTSDIVTDALTAMGYSAGDAGHLADVMAAASANANTNVGLMGSTFQYAAPLVGALGYSMEDTATAIGLMANAGIKGDKAGTALRAMLTRLASPTAEVEGEMENLGISLTDNEGKMKPLRQVMEDLRKGFSNLSETEKASSASAIAGKNAMSGLLAIVNSSDADFQKLTTAVDNSTGSAEKMSETMMDNVSGSMTMLKSAIEGVEIQIFEKFSPALQSGVKSITNFVSSIDWNASGEVIIEQIADGVISALPGLVSVAQNVIEKAASALMKIAPKALDVGIDIITNIIKGLEQTLPKLLSNAGDLVLKLGEKLVKSAPKIFAAGKKMLAGVVKAIPEIAKKLLSKDGIPKFIEQSEKALKNGAYDMVRAGIELFGNLLKAIPKVAVEIVKSIPNFIESIVGAFGSAAEGALRGFFEGLTGAEESAAIKSSKALEEMEEKHQEALEVITEQSEKISEAAKAWDNLKAAQEDQISTGLGEMQYYEDLSTELQTLYDKNGNVIEGYEKRAEFIKTTLSEALGIEKDALDIEKQGHDKVAESIQNVIDKKRGEIILQGKEKLYTEAIQKRQELYDDLESAQSKYTEAMNKGSDAAEKQREAFDKMEEAQKANNDRDKEYWDQKQQEFAQLVDNYGDEAVKWKDNIGEIKNQLKEEEFAIQDYEDTAEKVRNNDLKNINVYTQKKQKEFKDSGDATKAQLEKELTDTKNNRDLLKEIYEESGTEISKKNYEQAQKRVEDSQKALDDYNKSTKNGLNILQRTWLEGLNQQLATIRGKNIEFRDVGNGNVQMYTDGVKTGEPMALDEASKIGAGMVKRVDKKEDAKKAGLNFGQGLIDGLEEKEREIRQKAADIGNTVANALKKVLEVRSPSRVAQRIGRFFVEGLINGIDNMRSSAVGRVAALGQAIAAKAQNVLDFDALGISDIAGELTAPMNGIASSLQNSVVNNQRTINFTQNNYSPEPLSRIQIYRSTRNALELYKGVV